MSEVGLYTSARNDACDAIVDLIDTAGVGKLKIWDEVALTTQLAELTFSATAFGDAVAGVATAADITAETSAIATGTAAAFTFESGADDRILSGSVGATGSGEDLIFNTVSITQGDAISVTSLTVTVPETSAG